MVGLGLRVSGFAMLSVAVAACGGSDGAAPATTTTTLAPTTTVSVSYDLRNGSPADRLDSFTAHLIMSAELSVGVDLRFESEAVFVGAAFSCEVTTWYGSFGDTVSLVATSETTWIDRGDGFAVVENPLDAQSTLDLCPGWPGYWEGVTTDFPLLRGGELEMLNAISARRFDLAEEMNSFAGLGFPQDVTMSEAVVWVAEPAGWVARMHMAMAVGGETWAEWIGAEAPDGLGVIIDYTVWVTDPNEPNLAVEVPGVGPVYPGG